MAIKDQNNWFWIVQKKNRGREENAYFKIKIKRVKVKLT